MLTLIDKHTQIISVKIRMQGNAQPDDRTAVEWID